MAKKYPKYDAIKKGKKKASLWDRFGEFLQNTKRIVKVANKPSKKEYWMIFKICAIGIAILGGLSYVIQLIFSVTLSQYLGR